MHARTVPVSFDRLRRERRRYSEIFADAIQEPPRQPEMIRNGQGIGALAGDPTIADLELPLSWQNFGVCPINHQARVQTGSCMGFDGGSPECRACANAAVIWALRRGVSALRKSER